MFEKLSSVISEVFEQVQSLIKDYGSFFKLWLGTELNFHVSDPNDIEVRTTMFHPTN